MIAIIGGDFTRTSSWLSLPLSHSTKVKGGKIHFGGTPILGNPHILTHWSKGCFKCGKPGIRTIFSRIFTSWKSSFYATFICDPGTPRKCPLVKSHSYGKSPFLIYRKSTINGKFNSYVRHYQRVKHLPNIGIPIVANPGTIQLSAEKNSWPSFLIRYWGWKPSLKCRDLPANLGMIMDYQFLLLCMCAGIS